MCEESNTEALRILMPTCYCGILPGTATFVERHWQQRLLDDKPGNLWNIPAWYP